VWAYATAGVAADALYAAVAEAAVRGETSTTMHAATPHRIGGYDSGTPACTAVHDCVMARNHQSTSTTTTCLQAAAPRR